MVEFGDSEHTSASGTAKLAGNECPNVEKRVREARKMQKTNSGEACRVSSHVAAMSAPRGGQRPHGSLSVVGQTLTECCVSGPRVGWGATVLAGEWRRVRPFSMAFGGRIGGDGFVWSRRSRWWWWLMMEIA